MIKEYSLIAVKNLKKRRLRSFLTLIGIVISISVIFVLISVSIGLNSAIAEQFRTLGTDKFFIMAKGQVGAPGSGGAVTITRDDYDAISRVSGVKKITYFLATTAEVKSREQARFVYAIALEGDGIDLFFESGLYKLDSGKFLSKGDSGRIMIGSQYKYNKFFKNPIDTGDKLKINGIDFTVKGVLQSVGNPQDDRQIYMSEEDFRETFNIPDRIDQIMVQVDSGTSLFDVAEKVEKRLLSSRGLTEKTKDFTILTPEELLASFGTILNILTGFLLGIAAISLLVGGIGIANTMYTSVLERTKEIGVMKAIGAKNSDILLIFTVESGIIGLIGGAIGIIMGIGMAKLIEYIAVVQLATSLLKPAIPLYLVLGSLTFSFVVGAVSGILPAWNASKVVPVTALRYE